MIPLITAVFLACMLQTPLQIQQREIHEQGTHYAVTSSIRKSKTPTLLMRRCVWL
jgi:hypothetical protein